MACKNKTNCGWSVWHFLCLSGRFLPRISYTVNQTLCDNNQSALNIKISCWAFSSFNVRFKVNELWSTPSHMLFEYLFFPQTLVKQHEAGQARLICVTCICLLISISTCELLTQGKAVTKLRLRDCKGITQWKKTESSREWRTSR